MLQLKSGGLPEDYEAGLNMVVMMLEGTPITSFAASTSSKNDTALTGVC